MRKSEVDGEELSAALRNVFSRFFPGYRQPAGDTAVDTGPGRQFWRRIGKRRQMCRPALSLRNPGSLSRSMCEADALVAAGDEVEKGQLSPRRAPITDDGGTVVNRQKVRADADVMIRSRIPYREEQAITFSEKKYTGKQASRVLLQILGADFAPPIWKPSWSAVIR